LGHVVLGLHVPWTDLLTITLSGFLGWQSLMFIVEHLKDRTPKRGSEAEGTGLGALSKRVRSVDLGG